MKNIFKRVPVELDVYQVNTSFILREWGDSHGVSEVSKRLTVGTQIHIECHKNGHIRRIWVNGDRYGEYNLITTKAEILANCFKRGTVTKSSK